MGSLMRYLHNLFGNTAYNHIIYYLTPKNLSSNWSFGALSGFCFLIQILTGLFLSMYYIMEIDFAFLSVEYITRDVNCGWLIRYLYAIGASIFFFF